MRAASSALAPRRRSAARALAPRLAKYRAAAAVGFKDSAAYRANLVGKGLSYSIFIVIFSSMWRAVYALPGGSIAGYDRRSATWYFIVAELVMFCASGTFGAFAEEVKTGSVAYGLSRPMHFVGFQFAQSLGGMLTSLAVVLPLGLVLGTAFVGPPLPASFLHPPLLVASVSLAVSLNFLLQAVLGLTAFWVEENSAFYWIYSKLVLVVGTLMPLEFLPAGLQRAARWLPFPYVTWAPARIASVFEASEALSILGGQAAWTAAFLAIVLFVFRKGVKHVSVNGG